MAAPHASPALHRHPLPHTVVNVQGKITDSDQARVRVFDRSYLYGDSLYEVVRTLHGKILHMKEHLARLQKSAELCHMDLSQTLDHYAHEISRTYEEFKKIPGMRDRDAYCRLVVSRGEGKIGFSKSALSSGSLYSIIVQPMDAPSEEQLKKGLSLRIVDRIRNHPRALDPALKSGNYLNSLLAYLEGTRQGDDEAILLDGQGFVTEGTVFNVGYFKDGIFVTPPLDIGILDGITRREILAVCRKLKIPTREVRFKKERVFEADEFTMMSTTKGIFPVTRVNGLAIGNGCPGPLTLRVKAAFDEHCEALLK